MATYSNNVTMKVNRAISGATTVGAGCYAIVNYVVTSMTTNASIGSPAALPLPPIDRYFGPGQGIPATFTQTIYAAVSGSAHTVTATWTLQSGVEFINTP